MRKVKKSLNFLTILATTIITCMFLSTCNKHVTRYTFRTDGSNISTMQYAGDTIYDADGDGIPDTFPQYKVDIEVINPPRYPFEFFNDQFMEATLYKVEKKKYYYQLKRENPWGSINIDADLLPWFDVYFWSFDCDLEDTLLVHGGEYEAFHPSPGGYRAYIHRMKLPNGEVPFGMMFPARDELGQIKTEIYGDPRIAIAYYTTDSLRSPLTEHLRHLTAHEIGHGFNFTSPSSSYGHCNGACMMIDPYPMGYFTVFSKTCCGGNEGHFHQLADTVTHKP